MMMCEDILFHVAWRDWLSKAWYHATGSIQPFTANTMIIFHIILIWPSLRITKHICIKREHIFLLYSNILYSIRWMLNPSCQQLDYTFSLRGRGRGGEVDDPFFLSSSIDSLTSSVWEWDMFHMYGSIHVSDLAAQERGGGKLHHPLHIIHVACRQGHLHLHQWTTHPFDPDTLPTVTADDLICPPRRITVFPSGSHGCPVYFSIEFLLFICSYWVISISLTGCLLQIWRVGCGAAGMVGLPRGSAGWSSTSFSSDALHTLLYMSDQLSYIYAIDYSAVTTYYAPHLSSILS